MPSDLHEPLVQCARLLALALLGLEVDVRLSEQLGDAELVDRAHACEVLELRLELGVLDPRCRVGRVELRASQL